MFCFYGNHIGMGSIPIPPWIFRNLAMCVDDIHSYHSAALAITLLGTAGIYTTIYGSCGVLPCEIRGVIRISI